MQKLKKKKIVDFGNSVDPDEAAHNEPPHQHLLYLISRFDFSICYSFEKFYFNFADTNFVVSFKAYKGICHLLFPTLKRIIKLILLQKAL